MPHGAAASLNPLSPVLCCIRPHCMFHPYQPAPPPLTMPCNADTVQPTGLFGPSPSPAAFGLWLPVNPFACTLSGVCAGDCCCHVVVHVSRRDHQAAVSHVRESDCVLLPPRSWLGFEPAGDSCWQTVRGGCVLACGRPEVGCTHTSLVDLPCARVLYVYVRQGPCHRGFWVRRHACIPRLDPCMAGGGASLLYMHMHHHVGCCFTVSSSWRDRRGVSEAPLAIARVLWVVFGGCVCLFPSGLVLVELCVSCSQPSLIGGCCGSCVSCQGTPLCCCWLCMCSSHAWQLA
jgi:hypothetical protein